jgi:phosphoribosylanthranilate isomerase
MDTRAPRCDSLLPTPYSPLPKLKICGLFREADAEAVNEAAPDYAGFVFAESRRRVTPAQAARLRKRLRPAIETVGVFVDAPAEEIAALYRDGVIGVAQLHGGEDAAYIARLKALSSQAGGGPIPVIKAVKGAALTRLAEQAAQRDGAADAGVCATLAAADFLLFDSGAGSGTAFDWDLLPALAAGLEAGGIAKKWFLAGGISTRNIEAAVQCCVSRGAFGIDVSSGVETGGVKDREKMLAIANAVRRLAGRHTSPPGRLSNRSLDILFLDGIGYEHENGGNSIVYYQAASWSGSSAGGPAALLS